MARTRARITPGLAQRLAAGIVRDKVAEVTDAVTREARDRAPDAKTWVDMHDERVRHAHHETGGQTIAENLSYELPAMTYIRKGRGPDGKAVNEAGGWKATGGVDLAREPRDPELPAHQRVNCFPFDTPVSAPDVEAAVRAPYAGEMVKVTTRSGRILTGTPNHPVLTNRGWIGLGALDVGDDLFRRSVSHAPPPDLVRAEVAPDVQDTPPLIGEVYGTLAQACRTHRVSRVSVDFYGDRPAGDIDVVSSFGALGFDVKTVSTQQVRDFLLAETHEVGVVYPPPSSGPVGKFDVCSATLAPFGVGKASQALSFLGASVGHSDDHRFTAAPGVHASMSQEHTNSCSEYAERFGKRLLGLARKIAARYLRRLNPIVSLESHDSSFGGGSTWHTSIIKDSADAPITATELGRDLHSSEPGGIPLHNLLTRYPIGSHHFPHFDNTRQSHTASREFLSNPLFADAKSTSQCGDRRTVFVTPDEVASIERFPWYGHVYTLQTSSGIYEANSFIVRNCRCKSTDAGPLLAEATHALPVRVEGVRVQAAVECVFHRVAEAEFGNQRDTGAHFLSGAGQAVAARTRSR